MKGEMVILSDLNSHNYMHEFGAGMKYGWKLQNEIPLDFKNSGEIPAFFLAATAK